jgi:hypothetical protein
MDYLLASFSEDVSFFLSNFYGHLLKELKLLEQEKMDFEEEVILKSSLLTNISMEPITLSLLSSYSEDLRKEEYDSSPL